MAKILISGASSGLGQFLCNGLNAAKFQRDIDITHYQQQKYDMIIHCAVDARAHIPNSEMQEFWQNNINLTRNLLDIPHEYFVYMSSIDVYPKDRHNAKDIYQEDIDINANDINGIYGMMKYQSEWLVETISTKSLILRLSGLLGQGMRPNSLIKILANMQNKLSLHGQSTFNYIEYDNILNIIIHGYEHDINGIFNICADDNISLQTLCALYQKNMDFGDFIYQTPILSNQKFKDIFKIKTQTSQATIDIFWQKYQRYFE